MTRYKAHDKVFVVHSDSNSYCAKIIDIAAVSETRPAQQYKIHYVGWNSKWDEWVTDARLKPFTAPNKKKKEARDEALKLKLGATKTKSRSATKKVAAARGGKKTRGAKKAAVAKKEKVGRNILFAYVFFLASFDGGAASPLVRLCVTTCSKRRRGGRKSQPRGRRNAPVPR